MRYLSTLAVALLAFSGTVSAQWKKINDVDYVWGPFTIYNLSLFSETGDYAENTRPVMLSLKYMKPVDGRDFAISLARSWSNLGITLPEQEKVVDHLRKIMPNIKKGDVLSYIALEDSGYFILNDTIIDAQFNKDFNDAVVAVWLDPRVEIGKALLSKIQKVTEMVKPSVAETTSQDVASEQTTLALAVTSEQNSANEAKTAVQENIVEQKAQTAEPAETVVKNDTVNKVEETTNKVEDTADKADKAENSEVIKESTSEPKTTENTEKKEDESVEVLPPNDFVDLTLNMC